MSVTDSGCGVWRKSSYSTNGNCVEVASSANPWVLVRDSKDTGRPAIRVGGPAWRAFLNTYQGA
ncbi:DUF397 domain-containing protein [Sphaerisporangium dianthi]|uniref:DUF397 domain-containing protein n=1 Tax=Sphaerisporangium dianthi TaxID=1436120 RepID=A0ABV9CAQ1_9ACTN